MRNGGESEDSKGNLEGEVWGQRWNFLLPSKAYRQQEAAKAVLSQVPVWLTLYFTPSFPFSLVIFCYLHFGPSLDPHCASKPTNNRKKYEVLAS